MIKTKTNNHHTVKLGDMNNENNLDIIEKDTYTRESKPWIPENTLINKCGDSK